MAGMVRPLSPHLGVYRWYFTMGLSIAHRVSGAGLVLALVPLSWWLFALAAGPEPFARAQAALGGVLGGLVLFGFTLLFFYHALNGVRHLVWDTGRNLDKHAAYRSGVLVVAGAVALTLVTWLALLLLPVG
jgi:succinate dehydrogenase / fumarate reductase cytochrome b subunit